MAPSFDGKFDYSSHCLSLCCCAELTEPCINRFFAQQEDPNILLLESKRKEERHEPVDPENYEGVAIAMPTPKKWVRAIQTVSGSNLGSVALGGSCTRAPLAEFANSICCSLSFAGPKREFKSVQNARFKESPQTFSSSSSWWSLMWSWETLCHGVLKLNGRWKIISDRWLNQIICT